MKNLLFTIILIFPLWAHSQGLNTEIQQVKQTHDLMGGVVTVLCGTQISTSIPFGTADFTRNIPVTDSTFFRIASISKTITAMAFMKLYEQGLVGLDTDINSILGYSVRNPNFPNTPITARMLLSHTSTITDGTTYSSFLSATASQNPMPNISALLVSGGTWYTSGQFINKQPGSFYTYANINYGILGSIIEAISGQRFDVYCRQQIFLPLGIQGSFNVNDIPDINRVAVLYRKNGGTWQAQSDNYQGVQPVYGNLSAYIPGTNGLRFSPQGGLRISGSDLGTLFLLLMNHGTINGTTILNDSTVKRMLGLQWQYNGNNGDNYYGLFRSWGLGIHRITNTSGNDLVLSGSTEMFGHPGEAYGLVSDAYIDTVRRVGIIFITNGSGTGYVTGSQSAFYTVEQDVFDAVENYVSSQNCQTTTKAPQVPQSDLKCFPNPVSDKLFIENTGNEVLYYTISDLMGRPLQKGALNSQTSILNVTQLSGGIYFLRTSNGHLLKIMKAQQ